MPSTILVFQLPSESTIGEICGGMILRSWKRDFTVASDGDRISEVAPNELEMKWMSLTQTHVRHERAVTTSLLRNVAMAGNEVF